MEEPYEKTKQNHFLCRNCIGVCSSAYGGGTVGGRKIPKDFTVSYEGIKTADITAGVSVHDPSVIEVDGTYYIFGSHMSGASSEDLRNWTSIGDGYTQSNPIFDDLLGTEHVFDYTGYRLTMGLIMSGHRMWSITGHRTYITCIFARLRPGMHRICVMRFQINRKDRIHGRERSSIPDLQKIRSRRPMCSITWTSTMQKSTTSWREINITMRNIQMRSIRPFFMMRTEKCGWSTVHGRVGFFC